MPVKLIKIILFFLLCSVSIQAQETREYCQTIMDKGVKAINTKDYPQALKSLIKAELMAEKNHWPDKLWYIKNNLGNIYKDLSNYGEALGYYNEGLNIIKKNPNLEKNKLVIFNNIGILYSYKGDYQESIHYYNEAYQLSKKYDSDYELFMRKLLGVNIADVYNKTGEYNKAKEILMEVKPIQTRTYGMEAWMVNDAENLFLRGNIQEASQRAEALYKETLDKKKESCHICILELLSKIYAKQNQLDKAITYTKKALTYNHEWKPKIERYNRLAMLYHQKANLSTALAYKDSVIIAKDSLAQRINRQLFETNKIKFDIQKYQNELTLNKKSQQAQRKLFWVIIVALLVLFFFLYRWQKNRIIKQKQEKKLIENDQIIIALEFEKERQNHVVLKDQAKLKEERLKNKIAKKNRKLSTKALYLSDRNELIEDIMVSLSKIPEITSNKKVIGDIKTLKRQLKTDEEWEKFVKHFEEINPNFFRVIKDEHIKLNIHDIRFLCYMYMNLDPKEISTVLGISLAASKKRKQRIAQKMDINTEELHEYILKIG